MVEVIRIESEQEAWATLGKLLDGTLKIKDETAVVDFSDWMDLHIYLPDTPVEGSISPTMMEAFLELQKAINRTYKLVTSDTSDLRYLTNDEKEKLEFRVRVEKGSSEYFARLSDILEKIGLEAVAKMDPQTLAITIISVALIIGGTVGWRSWLHNKTQQRKDELDSEERKAELAVQQHALSQNIELARLLTQASIRQPLLQDVETIVEPARDAIVKAVGDEGGGTINETDVDAELANEISTRKRQQSEETRLRGNYRIIRVDSTSPDGFRVTIAEPDSGREVTAALQDALSSEAHRQAIQRAEWAKRPVYLELTARLLRGRIIDAVVLNAEDERKPE